jgi:hypothetical protein
MSDLIKWENGLVNIPLNAPLVEALNQVGNEGWEPWAVMGADDKNIRIAVKRYRRAITLATTIPNGLINN